MNEFPAAVIEAVAEALYDKTWRYDADTHEDMGPWSEMEAVDQFWWREVALAALTAAMSVGDTLEQVRTQDSNGNMLTSAATNPKIAALIRKLGHGKKRQVERRTQQVWSDGTVITSMWETEAPPSNEDDTPV